MKKKLLLTNVSLMLIWGSVQAQTRDTTALSEVVINENRLQIPFSKQSRNIQILTQEDIQRLPSRSLNELLANIPGVDIRQRGPFGTQADISIDGGSFEQATILLNGVKITDPQTGHHSMNLPIPLDAIERVEIIRGPASRLYGINALTGAINIVTKSITSNTLLAQVYGGSSFKDNVETQSGKYYGKGVQLGGQFMHGLGKHGVYLGHEDSNGQRYNSSSKNDKVYYDGSFDFNDNNQLKVNAGYIENRFGANGFYAAPGDVESYEVVKTAFSSIQSKHRLRPNLTLSPRISNRYNEDDYRYYRSDLSKARSRHYSNVFSADVNSTLEQSYGVFGVGVESRFEEIHSSAIGAHNRQNYGGYLDFKTESIERLMVNIGLYGNYNSKYGWDFFPGIDLGYDLSENWKLVFNAGSSQRIPSFTDLYLKQKANIGNADLTTERARQIEGGIKYLSARVIAQAGYFYRNIQDFIDWRLTDTDGPWQSFNVGKNKMKGFNASARIALNDPTAATRYHIALSYNYLDPKIELAAAGDSKYVAESLRHQVLVNFTIQHQNWLFTTANRYNERLSYKSYLLSDARLSYRLHSVDLYLDVQNIFDKSYIEAAAVPMPGRWFALGGKYQLHL